MKIELTKIKAHRGAICRGDRCHAKIPKGDIALYIGVSGPSSGDHEFICMNCIPNEFEKMTKVATEWYSEMGAIDALIGLCMKTPSDKIQETSEKIAEMNAPNLLELCKQKLIDFDDDILVTEDIVRLFEIESLPKTSVTTNPIEKEEVDFENLEILDINEKTIELCAGGDWQHGIRFSLVLKDGKLHYMGGAKTEWLNGIGVKGIIEKVFGNSEPPELRQVEVLN